MSLKYKFYIQFLIVLLIANIANAQSKAKVKYTETVSFDVPEEVKAMNHDMPSSGEFDKILLINESQCLYSTNKEDVKEEELSPSSNRRFMRRMRNVDAVMYKNSDTEEQVEFKDVFGKEFLVSEKFKSFPWKIIASEQRDILGYACMKAEYKDTSETVVAWFTTQVPLSFGPAQYHGLPGLILALSEGEKRVILATSVQLDLQDVSIEQPSKGEKVTEEEFKKISEEKRKEMEKMWGGTRKRMSRN